MFSNHEKVKFINTNWTIFSFLPPVHSVSQSFHHRAALVLKYRFTSMHQRWFSSKTFPERFSNSILTLCIGELAFGGRKAVNSKHSSRLRGMMFQREVAFKSSGTKNMIKCGPPPSHTAHNIMCVSVCLDIF